MAFTMGWLELEWADAFAAAVPASPQLLAATGRIARGQRPGLAACSAGRALLLLLPRERQELCALICRPAPPLLCGLATGR